MPLSSCTCSLLSTGPSLQPIRFLSWWWGGACLDASGWNNAKTLPAETQRVKNLIKLQVIMLQVHVGGLYIWLPCTAWCSAQACESSESQRSAVLKIKAAKYYVHVSVKAPFQILLAKHKETRVGSRLLHSAVLHVELVFRSSNKTEPV